jgi:SAM-dependent methyltransferase
MLDVARTKAGAASGKRIYFRSEGAAPRLAFADDVYDLVVSNLLVGEVPDPHGLLAEFGRVAKPGGRVIVTLPLAGTFVELHDILREVLVKRDRADAIARLDAYLARYPTAEQAERWMQRARLIDVTVEHERFTLLFKSAREFFFAPVIEYGPLPHWKDVAGKGQEMQEAFWHVKEAIDAYFGAGPFQITVDAGCLRGRKPREEELAQVVVPDLPEAAPRPPEAHAVDEQPQTGEINVGTGEIVAVEDESFPDEDDQEDDGSDELL